MSKFESKKKRKFLSTLSEWPSLEDEDNNLTRICKFNFSYFDSNQDAGQEFSDWTHKQLYELLRKLKDYTANTLSYLQTQRVGKSSSILVIYGGFPPKSDFTRPKHIPHQALWGRFRLGSKLRLVGFTIPTEFHKTLHKRTGEFFDNNTFYVVFLDRDHKFYLTEKK